jgi:radical SAM superfamily enzyme YgiQ (UPF0313 family)
MATTGLAERWIDTIDPVDGHYPLGLAILHAVAEQAGHSVETLYLVRDSLAASVDAVLAAVERTSAQVLGLSIITDNRVSSFAVIEAVRRRFPGVRIILGGVHTTVMHEQILTRYPDTVAVLGEGELTLPDLLDAFETGRDLATVAGIAYVKDGRVTKTACRPLVEDLDSLPLPRHDLFYSPQRTTGQLLTSRGCPFKCSFCVLDATSQRKVRARSPDKVVDEIELILATQPQTRFIHIYDDQFFADNKRVIAICDEIVRRGIKCGFVCQGRVKPISRDLVLALERAGFVTVTLGLETGAATVLEKCHKKITRRDVETAVSLFRDSAIDLTVLLIIGLPGENLQTVLETIDVCKGLQKIKYHAYDGRIQDLFIYPGTEICDIAKAAGQIDDDFWLTDADCPRFHVELREQEFTIFREMMLTNLCASRIFTPGGFAAQRDMIPHILKSTLESNIMFDGRNSVMDLLWTALDKALSEKRLALVAETGLPTRILTMRRKPGSDTDIELSAIHYRDIRLADLVQLGYQQGWKPITDGVERAVVAYLDEAFATGDGRLGRFAPLSAEASASRLRF